jgi:hypothetical protein
MEGCRGRVERALAILGSGAIRNARREMKLYAALGTSLTYDRHATGPQIDAAWTKALEIADSLDDAEYQLRSLRGLYIFHVASGRHRVALPLAQRFYNLAAERPDPNDRLIGEGMIGLLQHFLGDQPTARRHIEHVLANDFSPGHREIIRFQSDQRMVARVAFARVLWLQGFPYQAVRAAKNSIDDARAVNHASSLCQALALAACWIALLVGDLAAAEHYVGMLLEHSTNAGLTLRIVGG